MPKKSWKLLGKENIFKNKYVTLDVWKMRLPRGQRSDYFIHKTYDFVIVSAFTKNGKAVVLDQYYISQHKRIPALVAGIIEKAEVPKETAARELLEETGYKAQKIVSLGVSIKGKYATGRIFHFLALGAEKIAEPDLEAGEDINVRTVSFGMFKKMVAAGKITEAAMEMSAWRVLDYLKKSK